jgi:PAS domain S-box-containing protein
VSLLDFLKSDTILTYFPFFCQHLLEDLYQQKELWHTRNCLQTVVDTMPGFVWVKDMAGRHLKVNQAFCEMVGKSMHEVEGKEHYEIWGVTPEQYAEGEYVCLETDKAIADNPKPTLFKEQVLHSKLGIRQLETYKAPIFDEDGKMTFAAKKEANAAAGDDAAKAEVEEHDEPAALPTAEAGVNEDDVDSVA